MDKDQPGGAREKVGQDKVSFDSWTFLGGAEMNGSSLQLSSRADFQEEGMCLWRMTNNSLVCEVSRFHGELIYHSKLFSVAVSHDDAIPQ